MVKVMEGKDITEVIALHKKVLGHTLNAQVGHWFLEHLYSKLLESKTGKAFIYREENNHIVGFISICLDYQRLNHEITSSLSFSQKIRLGFYLVLHPIQLLNLFKKLRFGKYLENTIPAPAAYILTLGVDNQQQGKGIGKQLMYAVEQYFRRHEYKEYYLDTEESNTQAVGFYKKIGFELINIHAGNVIFRKNLIENSI